MILEDQLAHCPLVFLGRCNGQAARVLVDSGASHDFIARSAVGGVVHDQGEARSNHLVKLADGRTSEVDHVLPALL